MRFAYSKQLSPPGLMLPLFLRAIGSHVSEATEGKIDTGADMTVIPASLKDGLNLPEFGRRMCKGALDAHPTIVPTYYIEYSFDGSEYFELEVLSIPRRTVLLGRDLLNGLILTANGPQQYFEINHPST